MAKHPVSFLQAPRYLYFQIASRKVLIKIRQDAFTPYVRAASSYRPLKTFDLPKGEQKHYTQQFADMYFLRLAMLKPDIETIASEAWNDFELAGEKATQKERVLDVRQGELCWVVGTVYMEMPLKPNVLDDLAKEHWIAAPPPREKYINPDGHEEIFLEDESGRLRLTGDNLQKQLLVTGCNVAALGTENAAGEFEVLDVKIADLPEQPARTQEAGRAGKIAIVSGLGIAGDGSDTVLLDVLSDFLLGETLPNCETVAQISRLIIAGNSMAHASPIPSREEVAARPTGALKKYGHDTSLYNATPSETLDAFIAQILPSIPVTLIPGATDPASVAIPQQPLHPALFPHSRSYCNPQTQQPGTSNWFDSVSNPWQGDIDGWRFLGNAGQPVNDMYKYISGTNRLRMMEHLLRWRNNAPTAPDTLCEFYAVFSLSSLLLTGLLRELSFPGKRPVHSARMPACLLRRQPTTFCNNSHRRSRWTASSIDCCTSFQRLWYAGPARCRDT
jgi:DNA polymerase delta subunit 2